MPFDIGDTVPLTITVRDADGNPVNANTVELTIMKPDGTNVTPAPSIDNPPDDTGIYVFDYVPSVAGRYSISWLTTTPNTAYTDIFDVRETVPRYMISLADMKSHMSITESTYDEQIRSYIEAATVACEIHRNETIVPTTKTEVIASGYQRVLHHTPVISITTIEQVRGGLASFDPVDFGIDNETGLVWRLNNGYMEGPLRFTYRAGYSIIPADYVLATKIIVQHMWETQRGFGTGSTRFGVEQTVPGAFIHSIPWRALELLGVKAPIGG
jgi:Phage gp6-like head-tail connector protein